MRSKGNRFRKKDREVARINHRIRVPEVRVIGYTGEALGILSIGDALEKSEETGFDLVEVSPKARPPVCRIMDYGKFKYEKAKKEKEAKKKQHKVQLKEVKLHPKTESHDYIFKMEHARKFLLKGDRVKITMVYRGREMAHLDIGKKMLERFESDLEDIAVADTRYKMEGRKMISIFFPDKAKIKKHKQSADNIKNKPSEEEEVQDN